MKCGVVGEHYETPYFHPRHRYSPSRNGPAKNSMGPAQPLPHRCRTFSLLPTQMGMTPSAACECAAEQTVHHVVLQCPIHRPPHGLTVLDGETIEGCSTPTPRSMRPRSGLKELAQTMTKEQPEKDKQNVDVSHWMKFC